MNCLMNSDKELIYQVRIAIINTIYYICVFKQEKVQKMKDITSQKML